METRAVLRGVRLSVDKGRLVADMIRGKKVDTALADLEFSRKPLQEVFAYMGDKTKVTIVIDGDALKSDGYTKNMPQTFSLGNCPATKGILTILTAPTQEKLCLVVNDAKMEALITTITAATDQKLTIVPLDSLK